MPKLVIKTITQTLDHQIADATHGVTGLFSARVIRLGVTCLSRAGKTVFITSLVANLLERGRMPGLEATFTQATAMTLAVFFAIGAAKSLWPEAPLWRSGLEILAIGGAAAMVAYAVGRLLAP